MAWAEKNPRTGRWRGRYRAKPGGPALDLPETYDPSDEAVCRRDAAVAENQARNNRTYRRDAGKVTYAAWAAEWWNARSVEANTEGRDLVRLDKHIIPRWGTVALEDIEQDRDAVQAWVTELADTDLAAATVHKIFYLFSASVKAAMIAERIGSTPCVSIKLPQIPPSDERYLERAEYAAIREQLPTQRDKLLTDLLVYTGARWGEAVAIHRRRISRTRKVLSVHDAFEAATNMVKAYPKGKSKRGVPLTDDLLAALLDWMDHHPARCTMTHKKGSKCEGDLLFSDDDGTVLDYSHWEKYVWRAAVKASKVGHTRIHDLRHTFASWLIQAGRPLEEIGDLLGHASYATTQRYADLAKAHWEATRTALTGGSTAAHGMSEDALRAAIERLAADQPGRWADALAALNEAPTTGSAPNLPRTDHPTDGAKIIQMGRRRRSSG
jgi:integrase